MALSGRGRLDRAISKATGESLRSVRGQIARGEVRVNGALAQAPTQQVDKFTRVEVCGNTLPYQIPRYLMMNKPSGVVSATKDAQHGTALDLLSHPQSSELHIVGRLDYNSTGLLLLTNDGHWSRAISTPRSGLAKRYRVRLQHPASKECIAAFAEGMHFAFENITTLPATLQPVGHCEADVTLYEGKYHQIKRMFGRFGNKVLTLHRMAVGDVFLDPALAPGEYRELSAAERHCLNTSKDGRFAAASDPIRVPVRRTANENRVLIHDR